jgi:hypothetical protein
MSGEKAVTTPRLRRARAAQRRRDAGARARRSIIGHKRQAYIGADLDDLVEPERA